MRTNSITPNLYFGKKFDTINVLEVTTQRILGNNGLEGSKKIIKALSEDCNKNIGIGNRGYKYYAEILGRKIIEKYPEIRKATDEINAILEKEPYIKKQKLQQKIQPILKQLNTEIDITI